MVEREEKLIKRIIKLQKAQNSLNLDDKLEQYKKEIKESHKIIEQTKKDIEKLSSHLKDLKNKNENSNSDNENYTANKEAELNQKLGINSLKKNQLESLTKSNENFKNQEYILDLIKNWSPQTMFKYIESYDKKPE